MSTTLASLRTSIVDAIQLAVPDNPRIYPYDPREGFDWLKKVLDGNRVDAAFIASMNPSAEPLLDASDYTALAEIVMLRSVAEGARVALEDDAQLVLRRIRDIDHSRPATSIGTEQVTVGGRYLCYQHTIAARFYALQTIS